MGAPDRDIAQAKDFIAPPEYQRHRPEATLLYRLVAEHYPRFRDRRAREITLVQEVDGNELRTTLHPGEYAINAPGVWHTADVNGWMTAGRRGRGHDLRRAGPMRRRSGI